MTIDQIKELAGHRTVPPWVMKLVQEAVEIEREACAKVCEELPKVRTTTDGGLGVRGIVGKQFAAAIRSRSNKH